MNRRTKGIFISCLTLIASVVAIVVGFFTWYAFFHLGHPELEGALRVGDRPQRELLSERDGALDAEHGGIPFRVRRCVRQQCPDAIGRGVDGAGDGVTGRHGSSSGCAGW